MATGKGIKRKAGHVAWDLLRLDLDEIDLTPIPPHDPKEHELAPASVTSTKEWAAFKEGKEYVYQLLTEPLVRYKDAKDLAKSEQCDSIEDCTREDKFVNDMLAMIQKETIESKEEKIVVSITGNMGGGKSATLNSLFQCGNIARSNSVGESCTLASNLFSCELPNQSKPFLAKVTFYTAAERRKLLESYLRDFYRASHLDEDAESSTPQMESSASDAIRREASCVMAALFKDQNECATETAATAFLDSAKSENDPRILGKIQKWADELVNHETKGTGVTTVDASTATVLLSKLERYTVAGEDECGDTERSLCPLVCLVEFHFDDALTQLGISFLDTPGVSGPNKTRRQSSLKYRSTRTHALIASDSTRAKSDESVVKEAKAMRSHRADRIVVIATKSDVMDALTIPKGSEQDKGKVLTLQKQLKTFQQRLSAIDQEMTADMSQGKMDQLATKFQKKTKLEVLAQRAKNLEKAHRIHMRSENIAMNFQKILQEIVNEKAPMRILSISNWEYGTHLEGYAPKDAPTLDVEETGIPELRRLISTFPNEARLNEARHLAFVAGPCLLSRLTLYTSRSATDRKADMEVHVGVPLQQYPGYVNAALEGLWHQITHLILEPMLIDENKWTRKAGKLCAKWETLPTPAFTNLMNRHGVRRGRGTSVEINMSADLMNIDGNDINALFGRIFQPIHGFVSDISQSMDALVGNMLASMQEDDNAPFVAADPFYIFVEDEKRRMIKAMETVEDDLVDGFDDIRQRAATPDAESYLAEAMVDVYEKVRVMKQRKGVKVPVGGWPRKRKTTFTSEVLKANGIRAHVFQCVKQAIEQLIEQKTRALGSVIDSTFQGIRDGFDMRCDARDISDPAESELQNELTVNIQKAGEFLRKKMQPAVEALLRDFHGPKTEPA